MQKEPTHTNHDERRGIPDIRRRIRTQSDPAQYALKILLERLRFRGRLLSGSTIILLGFHPNTSQKRSRATHLIQETLEKHGAHVRIFDSEGEPQVPEAALRGADAVIIATDSRIFRFLRPADFRKLGIDTVIPTTLEA